MRLRILLTRVVPLAAALPAAAVAVAPAAADDDAAEAITASARDTSLRYGEQVLVSGQAPPGPVTLELRAVGATTWQPVASGTTSAEGRYRLGVALSRSGAVRVAAQGRTSGLRHVRVGARLSARARRLNVDAGRSAVVRGSLRRPIAGRVVALERREGTAWRRLDRDRTNAAGRFRLTHRTRRTDSALVRVRFAGDAVNAGARRVIGRLNVYRPTVASWYGPGFYGRRTACGVTFRATLRGVAHKSLPCGTRVTLRNDSHVVRATVLDRGPFVAGREFDVSPAIKQALGMRSTARVDVAY